MKDYQAYAEKFRKDAAECMLIRDLAADGAKREMFEQVASQLNTIAKQLEKAMLERKNLTK